MQKSRKVTKAKRGRRVHGPVDGLRASGWVMFVTNLCGCDRGREPFEDSDRGILGYSLKEYLSWMHDSGQKEFVTSTAQLMEWWNLKVCESDPQAPHPDATQWRRWRTGEREPSDEYRSQLIRYLEKRRLFRLAKGLRDYWEVGPLGAPLWVTLGGDSASVEKEWMRRLGQPLSALGTHMLDLWAAMGRPLPPLTPRGTSSESYGIEVLVALTERWEGISEPERAERLCAWLAARRLERATLPVRQWQDIPDNMCPSVFDGWGINTASDVPAYMKIMLSVEPLNAGNVVPEKIELLRHCVKGIQKDQRRYPLPAVYFKPI